MRDHNPIRALRLSIALSAALALAVAGAHTFAFAGEKPTGEANKPANAGAAIKPSTFNGISFSDIAGKTYTRAAISAHKATVFLFVSAQCPISNVYTPRFNALAADYGKRDVQVFAVYANRQEGLADVTKHVKDRNLTFPAVRDARGALADALGAKVTPEAVILNSQGTLCYRGRFDDNSVPTRVTSHDLTDALDAVLNDKPVANPITLAIGCAIRRESKSTTVAKGMPTYTHDVAPILRAKCEGCHHAGEVAPFSLDDYKQASAWAVDIKRYTQNGQMPPWKPASDYGNLRDVAAHTLSADEKALLAKWADGGAPLGNPKEMPAPAQYNSDWKMGTPDVVLQPEKEYHLGPDGEDVYRNFVVKTNFTEDRWIRAIECRPGNRSVVHHIINYVDANHAADKLEGQDHDGEPGFTVSGGGPGFETTKFLGGWAPGNDPVEAPAGVGTVLPKGSNLVIQVHYHRNGKPETDLTKIGLYFAHGKIDKEVRTGIVINFGFKIPYGETNHEVKANNFLTPIITDVHILTVMPHMHLLGRDMKIWAVPAPGTSNTSGGTTEKPLVWIKDWDFNWQGTYVLKEPMALAKGSSVQLISHYDNSEQNPRNPNRAHPRAATWGEQTTDEMCVGFYTFTIDSEHLNIDLDHPKTQSASSK